MLKMVFSNFLTVVLAATAAGTPVRHKSTHHVETSNATGSFVREHNEFFCGMRSDSSGPGAWLPAGIAGIGSVLHCPLVGCELPEGMSRMKGINPQNSGKCRTTTKGTGPAEWTECRLLTIINILMTIAAMHLFSTSYSNKLQLEERSQELREAEISGLCRLNRCEKEFPN